jgi:hypothetical protein
MRCIRSLRGGTAKRPLSAIADCDHVAAKLRETCPLTGEEVLKAELTHVDINVSKISEAFPYQFYPLGQLGGSVSTVTEFSQDGRNASLELFILVWT